MPFRSDRSRDASRSAAFSAALYAAGFGGPRPSQRFQNHVHDFEAILFERLPQAVVRVGVGASGDVVEVSTS